MSDKKDNNVMTSKKVKPDKTDQTKISIRGINPELYKRARIEALLENKPLGQWLNALIKEKLEEKKEE